MVTTQRMTVERQVVISSKPFDHVVGRLQASIGRPDKADFLRSMSASKTAADFEGVVQAAAGSSGLIEMVYITPGQYGGMLGSRYDPWLTEGDPASDRQPAGDEADGGACAGCRIVRAGDDSGR